MASSEASSSGGIGNDDNHPCSPNTQDMTRVSNRGAMSERKQESEVAQQTTPPPTSIEGRNVNLGNSQTVIEGDQVYIETQNVTDNQTIIQHQHVYNICDHETKRQEMDFDLEAVKRLLKEQYRERKGKMMLLPDISANMNDLFVDLNICRDDQPPGATPKFLKSYDDLFSIKRQQENQPDEEKEIVKRVLVKGNPGVGKSTIVSKLAYDWACGKQHSPVSEFQLLFVLTINDISTNTDLISVIQDQLLPDVSGEGLHQYIQSNASSVAILLDGYDEATGYFDKCKTIQNMLRSKSLTESCVIVTTRPKQVTKFCRKYGSYLQVEVIGFSDNAQQMYVERFMQSKQKASEFFNCCWHAPKEFTSFLCVPITLMMFCSLWIENQKLPSMITALYIKVVSHFADHAHAKTNSDSDSHSDDDLDRSGVQDWLHKVLGNIGKVALQSLFSDRLVFDSDDFEKAALEEACVLGVVTVTKKLSRSKMGSKVTFLHKTFQEMCAAHHLVKLAEESLDDFKRYLKQVVNANVFQMEHLLRFACGLSVQAAHLILPHVVQILCGHYKLKEKPNLYGNECQQMALFLLHETEVNNPQIGHYKELHASLKPLFKTVWLERDLERGLDQVRKNLIVDIIHSHVKCQQRCGRISHLHSWLQDVESVTYPPINDLDEEESDLGLLCAMSGMSALHLGERYSSYYDITEFLDHLASKNFSVTSLSELHFYHAIIDPNQFVSFISALPAHCKLAIYNCTLKGYSSDPISLPKLRELDLRYNGLITPLLRGYAQEADLIEQQPEKTQSHSDVPITETCISIESIKIESHLEPNHMSTFAKSLKHMHHLKHLSYSSCSLKPDDFEMLFDAFLKASQNIHRCNHVRSNGSLLLEVLELCHNEIGDSIQKFANVYRYMEHLRCLELRDTALEFRHCEKLFDGFIEAGQTRNDRSLTLETLNLSQNEIGDSVGKLAEAFQYMAELRCLNLDRTNMTSSQCRQLFDAILKVGQLKAEEQHCDQLHLHSALPLEELSMSYNDVGDASGIFAQAFKFLTNLRCLNLSYTKLNSSQCALLFDGFIREGRSLAQSDTCVDGDDVANHSEKGVSDRSKSVATQNPGLVLEELDMSCNDIGNSIEKFAQAYRYMGKLKCLDLKKTNLKPPDLAKLFDGFLAAVETGSLQNVKGMDMQGDEGSLSKKSLNIQRLNVRENEIVGVVGKLLEALKYMPDLKRVDVSECGVAPPNTLAHVILQEIGDNFQMYISMNDIIDFKR